MSNEKETKTNRTQLTDLPVAEQEMTAEEMENVQGGGATGFIKGAGTGTSSSPTNPQTALPPSPGTTTTKTSQNTSFGSNW